ncbi:MAG: hypothetical protein QM809_18200 [Gordonia sp. (in: high G+C Gram-positive bacteria)]|uniref:hypothetical protein n=1 Tax=Gordonia sp. (in: high G+C Gram-positive bacteria) TaxID=84139 RepID=UPI0039E541B8
MSPLAELEAIAARARAELAVARRRYRRRRVPGDAGRAESARRRAAVESDSLPPLMTRVGYGRTGSAAGDRVEP